MRRILGGNGCYSSLRKTRENDIRWVRPSLSSAQSGLDQIFLILEKIFWFRKRIEGRTKTMITGDPMKYSSAFVSTWTTPHNCILHAPPLPVVPCFLPLAFIHHVEASMCSTESALAPERRMGDSEVLEQSKLSQNDSQECFGVGGRFGANSAYVEDRSVVAERIWPCA